MGTNQEKKKITTNIKKKICLNLFLVLLVLPLFLEIFVSSDFEDKSLGFRLIDTCFTKYENKQDFVEFFNIGQGDCTLIKTANSAALIDFGVESDNNKIYTNLLKRGVKSLDLAVITHHHSDHMGGFLKLAENIKIKRLIINNSTAKDGENELYQKVIEMAKENGTQIILPKAGKTFKFGNAKLEILNTNPSATEENNRSIATMLSICNIKILFTGDSDFETEQKIFTNNNIKCDILKMGHHGSANSSYAEFLKMASPEFAVASCGYDNLYNHPSYKAVQRAEELGITVLRTDLDRNIRVDFSNKNNNYNITTERGAQYVGVR